MRRGAMAASTFRGPISRCHLPARQGLKFHTPVQCIAGIVSSIGDDRLARTDSADAGLPTQGGAVPHQTLLNFLRASQRQFVIQRCTPVGLA